MEMLSPFEKNVAKIIKDTLHLEIDPNMIDPEAPLYLEGLGLDSIDILEISIVLSKEFKITISSEEVETDNIFLSLRALSQYVQETGSTNDHVLKNSGIMNK